jgi:hypothetical protein
MTGQLHEEQGDTHPAARVLWRLGGVDLFTGRRDEAIARMERAFAVISPDEPDGELALLAGYRAVYEAFALVTDRSSAFGRSIFREVVPLSRVLSCASSSAAERARRSDRRRVRRPGYERGRSRRGSSAQAPRLVLALTEIGSQICRFLRVREGERIYRVVFGGCQTAATCGLMWLLISRRSTETGD